MRPDFWPTLTATDWRGHAPTGVSTDGDSQDLINNLWWRNIVAPPSFS